MVEITGIWLRRTVADPPTIEVLAEIEGKWHVVIPAELDDGPISHIVEEGGILSAPVSDSTLSVMRDPVTNRDIPAPRYERTPRIDTRRRFS